MAARRGRSGRGSLGPLLAEVRACRICADVLPLGPRPVLQADARARILIAGQAPGRRVHESGVPFLDVSGDRLRAWLGVDRESFYDPARFAILPMGFCFPGTGRGGDLPPRPECAEAWREALLARLSGVRLTLVLGRHALAWHLPDRADAPLAESVRALGRGRGDTLLLPHPSPRNQRWLRQNPWFEQETLPRLRSRVRAALG